MTEQTDDEKLTNIKKRVADHLACYINEINLVHTAAGSSISCPAEIEKVVAIVSEKIRKENAVKDASTKH